MKKLRIGILGAANIARKLAPAMQQVRGVELVAVASRDPTKAQAFAKEYGIEPIAGYPALLARDDIDAVYIPLPDGLHEEWTLRAAAAGKHVLCEKSLTNSYAAAVRMVTACRTAGVRLMEAFMFRFHTQHTRVRGLLAEEIGRPQSYYGRFGFRLEDPKNIRLQAGLSGGSLNDIGCYCLCGARFVFGREPVAVTAQLFMHPQYGVDTAGHALLEFDDQRCGHLAFGFQHDHASTYEIWAEKGSLMLPTAFPAKPRTKIIVQQGQERPRTVRVKSPEPYATLVAAFASEIAGKGGATYNLEDDALAQARAMEAIRLSAREHRRVELDEIR